MTTAFFQMEIGEGPLVACAVHDGAAVRPEIAARLRIDAARRRYEEDPYTGDWTSIAATRLVGQRSRFEFDLNRPRDAAVYQRPEDAWGLDVWTTAPSPEMVAQSLAAYDDFYAHLRLLLERLVTRHGRIVVFDLHSYNHRREGLDGPMADPETHPEINLGTRSMDRARWSHLVDRWLAELWGYDFLGRRLDVRENVKFFGGHLPTWIHAEFPGTVCVLAIEVKKFFMDEWTLRLDATQYNALHAALAQAAAGVADELART